MDNDTKFENPPAFPGRDLHRGMTLRDYFAGRALAGMIAGGVCDEPENTARVAYQLADAMLKARES